MAHCRVSSYENPRLIILSSVLAFDASFFLKMLIDYPSSFISLHYNFSCLDDMKTKRSYSKIIILNYTLTSKIHKDCKIFLLLIQFQYVFVCVCNSI